MTYPEVIDKYMSYAIGSDLTAFRNADAVLIATELQALDGLISLDELKHTYPKTIRVGRGGYIQHRYEAGRDTGMLTSTHYLQRAIFLYLTLGACTSVDAVEEITTILCTTKALSVASSTFHFWVSSGAGATTEYYVWIKVNGGADPTESGTAIEADISGATTATDVAAIIAPLINAAPNVGAGNVAGLITITNVQLGGVPDCSSHEGISTGYTITITTQGTTIHTITLNSSQTSVNYALHYESELSGEDIRADLLGHVPKSLSITCNQFADGYIAYQTFVQEFAYSRFSGGDLVKPDDIIDKPLSWDDLMTGTITFKYNGTAVEIDELGVTIDVPRVSQLVVTDGSGYPTKGKLLGLDYAVKLRVKSTGNMLKTIAATAKGSYAGDLDITFKWQISADHYVQLAFDKMYLVPESLIDRITFDEEGWFTGYELLLEPYDDTSSLTVTCEDHYNKTFYEND